MAFFFIFVAALCIGQQLSSVFDSVPKLLILFSSRCFSVVVEEFKNGVRKGCKKEMLLEGSFHTKMIYNINS